MLIRFTNVARAFGADDVLRDVTFQIDPRQKIGLVGANGSGKTTLLRLVEHPDERDRGEISRASNLRVGRLEQIPALGDRSVHAIAIEAFDALIRLEEQLGSLESAIAERPDDAVLLDRYATAQHEFEFRGVNRLDEFAMATPAIAGDRLLIRTQSKLYSIREAGTP